MKKLFLLLFVVVLCGAAFGQTIVVSGGATRTKIATVSTSVNAAVSATHLVSNTVQGWYCITARARVTTAGTSANDDFNLSWYTPDNTSVTAAAWLRVNGGAKNTYPTYVNSVYACIEVKAGGNIDYTVTYGSTGSTVQYDILVEKLEK